MKLPKVLLIITTLAASLPLSIQAATLTCQNIKAAGKWNNEKGTEFDCYHNEDTYCNNQCKLNQNFSVAGRPLWFRKWIHPT